MAPIRRLVVDVLKPHDPPMPEFTEQLTTLECVAAATASLIELDREVQNVKLTFEGADLDVARINEAIDNLGGSVHSVDQVACGEYVATDRPTPQDT